MNGFGGGFGGGPGGFGGGGGFDWNGNGSRDAFDGYMDYKTSGSDKGGGNSSGGGNGGGGSGIGCGGVIGIIVAISLISLIINGASWDAIDTLLALGFLAFLFFR